MYPYTSIIQGNSFVTSMAIEHKYVYIEIYKYLYASI